MCSPFFRIFATISCNECNIIIQKPTVKYLFSGIIYRTTEYTNINMQVVFFPRMYSFLEGVGRYLETTGPTKLHMNMHISNNNSFKYVGTFIRGNTNNARPT